MIKTFWRKLVDGARANDVMRPCYAAVVDLGRQPHWYLDGEIPDSIDGRFAVITNLLCLVLLRLESEGGQAQREVWLTELFVEDMDGQLREIGIGDLIVGKNVGKMMGALGGRLAVLRQALPAARAGDSASLDAALLRNLYDGEKPSDTALAHSRAALTQCNSALATQSVDDVLAGNLPRWAKAAPKVDQR